MRQLKIDRAFTPRSEHSLTRYLGELERIPLLEAREEVELAAKVRAGDRAAMDKLIRGNLRFVVSVAKKYQYMGMQLSDLIAEGNLGLIRAAQDFDETKGFKFISYAVWWIRQSIILSVANHLRTVRLPASVTGKLAEIKQAYELLEQELERPPSDVELAERLPQLDLSEPILKNVFSWGASSLDAPRQDMDGESLGELLVDGSLPAPDGAMIDQQLKVQLANSMRPLAPLERAVICELFGMNELGRERTVLETAALVGINPNTVKYVKRRSLAKMRGMVQAGRAEL